MLAVRKGRHGGNYERGREKRDQAKPGNAYPFPLPLPWHVLLRVQQIPLPLLQHSCFPASVSTDALRDERPGGDRLLLAIGRWRTKEESSTQASRQSRRALSSSVERKGPVIRLKIAPLSLGWKKEQIFCVCLRNEANRLSAARDRKEQSVIIPGASLFQRDGSDNAHVSNYKGASGPVVWGRYSLLFKSTSA